jgi:hypothetical protein
MDIPFQSLAATPAKDRFSSMARPAQWNIDIDAVAPEIQRNSKCHLAQSVLRFSHIPDLNGYIKGSKREIAKGNHAGHLALGA